MRSSALLLAAFASLSSFSLAQEVTVPEGMETTYTGNTTLLWRSTAFRYQCVYDSQHFTNQSLDFPIQITRLRFRPLNGTVDAGGQVYNNVTITLSTATTDSQTMVTDFATNVGLDVVTVYQGDVTLLPVSGTTPNDHHIDITLQTPFLYNPTVGPLLVDVTAPTAPSAAVPNMAASNNHLTQFARRNSSATPTATTGALSGFAAAMKIDYNILPGTARRATYGPACSSPRMAYELFLGGSTPDLTNTGQQLVYDPVTNNYIVIQTGPNYQPVGANAVDLLTMTYTSSSSTSWDDASITMSPTTMATGFPFPSATNATVTEITINSNGKVYLGNTVDASFATNGANYGSLAPFAGGTGAGLPVLSPFNVDLDPTVGGNLWYEDPSPNGGVRITWDNIANWQDPTGPTAGANFIQMEMLPGGVVTFAYGNSLATTGSAANDAIVGFSAGGNEEIGGLVDWSAINGYQTGSGQTPVLYNADARPVTNTTFNLVASGIPATGFGTLNVIGTASLTPGIDLGFVGMPGCQALVNPTILLFTVGTGSTSLPVSVPNTPTLSGAVLFAQGLAFVPAVNNFGALTTNGVELTIGVQ